MEIFSDNFGRCIWLEVSPTEVRMDLQDLTPTSEYERCATVFNVEEICNVLELSLIHI